MSTATAETLESKSPAPEAADEWSAFDTLNEPERRFVRRALLTGNYSEAAEYGGWQGEDAPARVLGRPRVRAALLRLAPLFMADDPKRIARLMLPFWGGKLLDTAVNGSDAQATTAAKELSALAGVTSSKVEHIHASLADVLNALDRRASDKRALALEAKRAELPEHASDTESVGPTTLDAIWDPVLPAAASKQAKPDSSPARSSKAPKRGPARRRKTPAPRG